MQINAPMPILFATCDGSTYCRSLHEKSSCTPAIRTLLHHSLQDERKSYPLSMYINVISLDVIHEILGCRPLNEGDASAALVGA